ncbi:MAG: hypothetical protein SFU21_17225 [Flavihumibacter sp.]|nr:hypothetical protein [Flavihumibacter sp.]
MSKQQNYKSNFSYFFYIFVIAITIIIGFATYRLVILELNTTDFLFIAILSFTIAYAFSFRFVCVIVIKNKILHIKYLSPFKKNLQINLSEIRVVEKYEDSIYRYYKKLFIKTKDKDYLLKYNISDSADIRLLEALKIS